MIWNLVVARSASKGCPNKAIRPLPDGSTCLSRALNVAMALPGRAALSTDYDAYACDGPVVYVPRPALLAHDEAPMIGVIIHALANVGAEMDDTLVLLQVTSPFRTVATVTFCVDAFALRDSADSHCTAMPYPVQWSPRYVLNADHPLPIRRQDIAPTYRPNGGAYVSSVRQLLTGSWGTMGWVVSPEAESLSIDSEADWLEAERRVRAAM